MCSLSLYVAKAMVGIFVDVLLINFKEQIMNNISLKNLSITVVVASLVSNFVFANNDVSKTLPEVVEETSYFSQLITDYDTDKSNSLSEKELVKNDKLSKIFNQLDLDGNKEINEKEFNQYLASLRKSLT